MPLCACSIKVSRGLKLGVLRVDDLAEFEAQRLPDRLEPKTTEDGVGSERIGEAGWLGEVGHSLDCREGNGAGESSTRVTWG